MVVAASVSVGRKKSTSERKTKRVEIMATPTWVADLERLAESWGMSVSDYVRLAVEEKKRRDSAANPVVMPETNKDTSDS